MSVFEFVIVIGLLIWISIPLAVLCDTLEKYYLLRLYKQSINEVEKQEHE